MTPEEALERWADDMARMLFRAWNNGRREPLTGTILNSRQYAALERAAARLKEKLMNFGQAIELAKQGKRVARAGWNGKGMWVTFSPGIVNLSADRFWAPANRKFAEEQGGSAHVLPCFTMKTADDKILIGWLASQSDMAAEDWEEV